MHRLLSDQHLKPQSLSHATALPAIFYTDAVTPKLDAHAVFAVLAMGLPSIANCRRRDYIVTPVAGLP